LCSENICHVTWISWKYWGHFNGPKYHITWYMSHLHLRRRYVLLLWSKVICKCPVGQVGDVCHRSARHMLVSVYLPISHGDIGWNPSPTVTTAVSVPLAIPSVFVHRASSSFSLCIQKESFFPAACKTFLPVKKPVWLGCSLVWLSSCLWHLVLELLRNGGLHHQQHHQQQVLARMRGKRNPLTLLVGM
jgi:hypothetical protein